MSHAILAKASGNYTRIPNVSTSPNHSTARTYPQKIGFKKFGDVGLSGEYECPLVWNSTYSKWLKDPLPQWMIDNGKLPAGYTKYIMLIATEKLGSANGQMWKGLPYPD